MNWGAPLSELISEMDRLHAMVKSATPMMMDELLDLRREVHKLSQENVKLKQDVLDEREACAKIAEALGNRDVEIARRIRERMQ